MVGADTGKPSGPQETLGCPSRRVQGRECLRAGGCARGCPGFGLNRCCVSWEWRRLQRLVACGSTSGDEATCFGADRQHASFPGVAQCFPDIPLGWRVFRFQKGGSRVVLEGETGAYISAAPDVGTTLERPLTDIGTTPPRRPFMNVFLWVRSFLNTWWESMPGS